MAGKDVDTFVDRLRELMGRIPDEQRSEMLVRVGRMDGRMRQNGQLRPTWHGPLPEAEILGSEVVVPTPSGEQVGPVVFFGIAQDGAIFERSVFVVVPASGTLVEAAGSSVRLARGPDLERMRREVDMARTIERVEAEPKEPARRKRHERDPGLTARMLGLAREAGLDVMQRKTFHRIDGTARGRSVYVSADALRVDLSGFTVEHPAVRQVTPEQAKEQHLGSVRGQIVFTDREAAEEAYLLALEGLL